MTNSCRRGEGEETEHNDDNIMIIINNYEISQGSIANIMHQKDGDDDAVEIRSNVTVMKIPLKQTSGDDDQIVSEWVGCDPIDTDQLLNVDASTIFDAEGDVLPCLAPDFSTTQPSAQSSPASTSSSSRCSSCSSSSWAAKDESTDGTRSINNAKRRIDSTSTDSFSQSVGAWNNASCSSSTIVPKQEEGIDALDGFGEMDLLENMDLNWDPSIFPPDDINRQQEDQEEINVDFAEPAVNDDQNHCGNSSQELGQVFFEWLKSNKESISPQDLRSIKLKKSTIESAARRLGGGKEGMLQLLKLILAWVQNHHLQKKQNPSSTSTGIDLQNLPFYYQNQHQQPYSFPHSNGGISPWFHMPLPPYQYPSSLFDPCASSLPSVAGYPELMEAVGYGLPHGETHQPFPISSAPPADSDTDQITTPWQQMANHHIYGDQATGFPHGSNYDSHPVLQQECMSKSATKEARKKRMARQRRFFFHHRHTGSAGNEKAAGMIVVENGGNNGDGSNHQNDQMAWSSSAASVPNSPNGGHGVVLHRHPPVDRRQGWKTEKNLRLLLQKVLKHSDVGSLGRIVLPKKEAEMHLPELEARDGISIAMEDIGTSRVWNMRYRFWPNNKSRMYLLENTGDFVRSNGLQEGDFIVIYSDVKCGKYLIRGVKVPNPGGNGKLQGKAGRSKDVHVSAFFGAAVDRSA